MDDLGTVRSEHRARVGAVAWQLVLAAFCFAVVYACAALPFGRWHGTSLERWGVIALFGAGGGILVFAAWNAMRTRVELCDGGFRYRGTPVRWHEINEVEGLRVNGALRALTVHTRHGRFSITQGMERFERIVIALRDRSAA